MQSDIGYLTLSLNCECTNTSFVCFNQMEGPRCVLPVSTNSAQPENEWSSTLSVQVGKTKDTLIRSQVYAKRKPNLKRNIIGVTANLH